MYRITSIFLTILFLGLMSASVTHAETENYKLVKQWGSEGSGNGQFEGPYGITVDSSNNIYVADGYRIQKFDSNGQFITKWGSKGTGDGQFDGLSFIAVDSSSNVYVVDPYNHRIEKFDSNGKFITKWGSYGSGKGQFEWPSGIAVDSSGNVYVGDFYTFRIQKFDSNGKFITQWGSEGLGNGQFEGIYGIAVDSSGNVYAVDADLSDETNRIEKFDSNGKFISKWDIFDLAWYPNGIAVDSTGNIYATADEEIFKLDSNGPLITEWSLPSIDGGQTMGMTYIAVDSSGNVYDAYTYDSCILKYTLNNTSVKPVAAFSASPTSGKAPLTVTFKDTSTRSPTSWRWSFGDGAIKTSQNPTHTYSKIGNYTVKLTVTNAAGINTVTKTNYIKVIGKPVASFSAKPTSGTKPLTVTFKDTSTGSPTSWRWSFGDGSVKTSQNPAHTYSKAGSYTVKLTVANVAGSITTTKTNYIVVK